jgi:23S rRNA pseudouridine2605 synthase
MGERIQKLIQQAGIASRRKAEEFIIAGVVKVNGKIAKIGESADPLNDVITVHDKPIACERHVYLLFNKPTGCVSTLRDPQGRKTILDYIDTLERVFPIGRLDYDSEGLLILTNDGAYANNVMHPRYEVKKTYEVRLNSPFTPTDLQRLRTGILIDGRPCQIHEVHIGKIKTDVQIMIHEGRKHIVKLIFQSLGYRVLRLKRTRVGKIELKNIKPGQYVKITYADAMRALD